MKTNKPTREELEERRFNWMAWAIIFGSTLLIVIILYSFEMGDLRQENTQLKEQINGSFDSTTYFDNLNKNCGGSFVTKLYGEEEYFVFTSVCIKGDYCKTSYIPLKDCEVLP